MAGRGEDISAHAATLSRPKVVNRLTTRLHFPFHYVHSGVFFVLPTFSVVIDSWSRGGLLVRGGEVEMDNEESDVANSQLSLSLPRRHAVLPP